jgi:hypothetical protein
LPVYALLLPQLLIPELAYRKEYVKALLNEVSKKGHSEYRRENQGGGGRWARLSKLPLSPRDATIHAPQSFQNPD